MNGHSKDSLNYYYLWLCLPLLLSANIMIQSLPPPIVLDPLPIVSPPSFGLYKNSDFLTCRCMSLIVAVFWLVLISALIYTQKLISLFGCNLECMCVRHTMHHYCTTDHSVPQAVYRSLVVPCPHPTFSWGKDLVTIECFLAVVLCQHAVSRSTQQWHLYDVLRYIGLFKLITAWVVSDVTWWYSATQYYQPMQWSHIEPKTQQYEHAVKPYIIEGQYCKHGWSHIA